MDFELGTLANNFPLYFRAPTLMALVWILWGVNVYVFRRYNLDYAKLLDFDSDTLLSPRQIIWSGMSLLGVIALLCVMYANQWPFHDVLMLPTLMYTLGVFLFVVPVNILHRSGRERLLQTFYRVLVPRETGVAFVEVVLGDILTSIAKVLADLEVTACVLFVHQTSPKHAHTTLIPNSVIDSNDANNFETSVSSSSFLMLYAQESGCADSWMRPFVTSLPFLLRLRQCLHQYWVTKEAIPNLPNAFKYSTALPVIWISAYTYHYPGHHTSELRTAWLFFVSLNSFVSFMWDVVMDWGLCRKGSKYALLRDHLTYNLRGSSNGCASPVLYYCAIAVDFVLRVLWSFKLSVHFQLSQEGVIFVLEVCEVFRRFLWVFIRVEWQAVSKATPKLESVELEPLTNPGNSETASPRLRWGPEVDKKYTNQATKRLDA